MNFQPPTFKIQPEYLLFISTTLPRSSIFGRLLSQVLENPKYNVIPLNRELETLHYYIDLEKLRLDSDVTYEEWNDPDLVPESIHIPPFLVDIQWLRQVYTSTT